MYQEESLSCFSQSSSLNSRSNFYFDNNYNNNHNHNPPIIYREEENIIRQKIKYNTSTQFQFKIILIGEAGTGKTSIINRFLNNTFKNSYKPSLSIDFKVKDIYINSESYATLKIWDTCGEEKYRSITKQFYRDSNGVLLIYDLSKRDSLKKLNLWLEDVKNVVNDDCVIFIVGNKNDIYYRDYEISEEGKNFAYENNIEYFEVSAKTGGGIYQLFKKIAKQMVNIEVAKKYKNKEEFNCNSYNSEDKGGLYLKDFLKKYDDKDKNKFCC